MKTTTEGWDMNLLLGNFDSPIDDIARNLVFSCLRPLRTLNYPRGASSVQMTESTSVSIVIDRRHAVMLSLVDRILRRAVDDYQNRYSETAKHTSTAALFDAAWRTLTNVRAEGYAHGVYDIQLDGRDVALQIGRWDAVLLEQCDSFLYELYRKNWWLFDAALAEGQAAIEPRLSGTIERAA